MQFICLILYRALLKEAYFEMQKTGCFHGFMQLNDKTKNTELIIYSLIQVIQLNELKYLKIFASLFFGVYRLQYTLSDTKAK